MGLAVTWPTINELHRETPVLAGSRRAFILRLASQYDVTDNAALKQAKVRMRMTAKRAKPKGGPERVRAGGVSSSHRAAKHGVRPYGDESREIILAAAQKLFAARGLHATSMQEIADAAHLSRATVFNQFGSKHLLLDAITAKSLRAYRDILAVAFDDASTPTTEILQSLFLKMSVGLERNRALYREVFTEIRKISMGLDAEGQSPGLKREAFDLVVRIFARGQARGELSRDHRAEVLATAYDSLLSGAVTQWLHAAPKLPLGPLLTSLAAVFLTGAAAKH